METFNQTQIAGEELSDWKMLSNGLHARFKIKDFNQGGQFIAAVCAVAEQMNHHPDIKLTYGNVDIRTVSHDADLEVTRRDIDLARAISGLGADAGLTSEIAELVEFELALDTANQKTVAPFWSALLTGSADNIVEDMVVDPSGRVPLVWFQTSDNTEEPRQRWHMDVWLAPEVAGERIRAAVAAGGTVVNADNAPSFTVLSDPDGNRACVCTPESR